MNIKEGATIKGCQWQVWYAALMAESVFKKYGTECVITAGTDGKHMADSLHYKGLAIDVRTFMVPGRELAIRNQIRELLGPDYDVLIERDHIHIEFQPKG
jgi:hypothetical protein